MKPHDSEHMRRDRAVVMARGFGSRMGSPKGLLRFQESGATFLRTITDLYLEMGIPVDVVTLAVNAAAYAAEMPPGRDVRIIAAEPGGDTALTLLTARRAWRVEGKACSHVWAHPVDMPLVTADTLGVLREWSVVQSVRAVRPSWHGVPGHPVLLPVEILDHLESQALFHDKPLRIFLEDEDAGRLRNLPVMLEVADQGVVRDFDCPEDLEPGSGPVNNRETP